MKQILENKEIIIIDLKGHPPPTPSGNNYHAVNQNADALLNLQRKQLRQSEELPLQCQLPSHETPTSTMLSTFSPFHSSAAPLMVSSETNFADLDTMFTIFFIRVASFH